MKKSKKSKKTDVSDLAGERTIKRFRVAREGQTVDGRSLSQQEIIDIAETYNPVEYTARINCEHISGWFDGLDGKFSALGDVIAVDCKLETFNINGQDVELMCLYATLSALPKLVQANKEGKKLFTSIEFYRKFADTGRAYLVGLAVTDSPASRGTEPLKFNTKDNTLTSELQELTLMNPTDKNAHTPPTDDDIPPELTKQSDETPKEENSFLNKLTAMFKKHKGLTKAEQDVILDGFTQVTNDIDELTAEHTQLKEDYSTLANELENLKTDLANQDFSTQIDLVSGNGQELTEF